MLLQAHAGAQETLRQGAVACQDKIDRQKGPKGPYCGQIWSAFGKKVPGRAWGRVWYSGGSQKKSHVALGVLWGKRKKKDRVGEGGSPTRAYPPQKNFRRL